MISFDRYINIVSGVGGAGVRERELILRIITASETLPPGIVAEFSNADSVMQYFGASSVEYKRAVRYFGFINKSTRSPSKISFGRLVATAIAPMIVGDTSAKSLSTLQAISSGTLTLTVGGSDQVISSINLSTAATLTQVASIVQTEIRKNSNAQLANATVVYNTNTQQFILTGSVAGSGTIVCKQGTGTDIGDDLGFLSDSVVNVTGQAADTPLTAISKSAKLSSNFGSFLFVPRLDPSVAADLLKIIDVAEWNHSQNNKYMFLQGTTIAGIGTLYNAIKGFSGAASVVEQTSTSLEGYTDQLAAEILAATDYTRPAANQSYMYYQSHNRNATVTDDGVADTCDNARANYIGVTETAGQQIAFFQRGVLMGGSTAAVDMNVYANEMWFKDHIGAAFMSALLNLPAIPADEDGRAIIISVLQTAVQDAKDNGVITTGKTLSNTQKQYINQVTSTTDAWRQVQTDGAYFDASFKTTTTEDGRIEYYADYMLLYSKGDAIRKVTGSNTMI